MARFCKVLAPQRQRPPELTPVRVDPSRVTDVFFDFDATLTTRSLSGMTGYVLPLLEKFRGLRVCDRVDPEGLMLTWEQLDARMAAAVPSAAIDVSETSFLGTIETRQRFQHSLKELVSAGIRLHVLTMGTAQTSRALLGAAGYNLGLFSSWLGPADMARNQGLRSLMDNGDGPGEEAAGSFEFDVDEDIAACEHLLSTGEQTPVLQRILTMERRLSKADLMLALVGKGGVLVDDNFSKNIFDAAEKGVMYIHVDPDGVERTSSAIAELAREVRASRCGGAQAAGT